MNGPTISDCLDDSRCGKDRLLGVFLVRGHLNKALRVREFRGSVIQY